MQKTPWAAERLIDRPVGAEARKTFNSKLADGFVDRYLSGAHILDIGYKGYVADAVPIMPQALGIDLDYPGYDGRSLPFADNSQDAVYSSHCLEHIADYRQSLREWFRVLKPGGHLILIVPHQFLYEKRHDLPSRWNRDHKRFYTPASLMAEIERSLAPNSYRLRHLIDNDRGYDYSVGPDRHAGGCYEIELIVEKITPPDWRLDRASPLALRKTRAGIAMILRRLGRKMPEPVQAFLRSRLRQRH